MSMGAGSGSIWITQRTPLVADQLLQSTGWSSQLIKAACGPSGSFASVLVASLNACSTFWQCPWGMAHVSIFSILTALRMIALTEASLVTPSGQQPPLLWLGGTSLDGAVEGVLPVVKCQDMYLIFRVDLSFR